MKFRQVKVGGFFYSEQDTVGFPNRIKRKPRKLNDKFLASLSSEDDDEGERARYVKFIKVAKNKACEIDVPVYNRLWTWGGLFKGNDEVLPASRSSYRFLTAKEGNKLRRKLKDSKVFRNGIL
jgi:hypothetical protein